MCSCCCCYHWWFLLISFFFFVKVNIYILRFRWASSLHATLKKYWMLVVVHFWRTPSTWMLNHWLIFEQSIPELSCYFMLAYISKTIVCISISQSIVIRLNQLNTRQFTEDLHNAPSYSSIRTSVPEFRCRTENILKNFTVSIQKNSEMFSLVMKLLEARRIGTVFQSDRW